MVTATEQKMDRAEPCSLADCVCAWVLDIASVLAGIVHKSLFPPFPNPITGEDPYSPSKVLQPQSTKVECQYPLSRLTEQNVET